MPEGTADYPKGSPSLMLVGRLGGMLLMLVSAPIIARALGPAGRGETAAILAVYTILPAVLAVGVPLDVRRRVAIAAAGPTMRGAKVLCLLAFIPSVAITAPLALTLFAEFDPSLKLAAISGAVLSPLTMSWMIDVSLLIARRHYIGIATLQLVQPGVFVLLILVLWASGSATTEMVVAAYIAGNFANFIAGLILTRIPVRGERVPLTELVHDGARYYGGSIAQIAGTRIDQVLALPLIGAAPAGIYAVAATVAAVPLTLGHALAGSYFTLVARAGETERRSLQAEAIRSSLALAAVLIPLLALASWALTPILFGDAFTAAIPVACVALLGGGLQIATFVGASSLNALGYGGHFTRAQVLGLVALVAALVILGPPLGAMGVALASSVGFVTTFMALLASARLLTPEVLPRASDLQTALRRLLTRDGAS